MNTNELRAERIRQGKNVKYMARVIGKGESNYAKKERGIVKFDPNEIVAIQNDRHLSPVLFNAIFFDSKLLFGKFPSPISPDL